MHKTIFLGSKYVGYKCLEYLIQQSQSLNIEICGILTKENIRSEKDFSFNQIASENSIPIIPALDHICELDDIDFIISVQYHLILQPKHICVAKKLAINLHMAPLPGYRGCNQFSYAIYNREKTFGTTIHRLEEGVDNGAIIFERKFDIPENCLVSELSELTVTHSIDMFCNNVRNIFEGEYELISQDTLDQRNAHFYLRADIEKLKEIDIKLGIEDFELRARATAMPGFEPPYIKTNNRKYYIIPEELYKII